MSFGNGKGFSIFGNSFIGSGNSVTVSDNKDCQIAIKSSGNGTQTVVINGVTFTGKTIQVCKNCVIVDGVEYSLSTSPDILIQIESATDKFSIENCNNVIVKGNVSGGVNCTKLHCDDVTGDVNATKVSCENIVGDVSATKIEYR